jgi:antitoxin component of RelBE/YafQ-DinJ toxin-antitoxin module
MAESTISLTIDDELFSQAEEVLADNGMSIASVVSDLLHKLVNKEIDPIDLNSKIKLSPRAELCGILEGKVWCSDDFDDSMEDDFDCLNGNDD